jgi:hypothetical protein
MPKDSGFVEIGRNSGQVVRVRAAVTATVV